MSWMLWLCIYLLIPGSFLLYAFVTDLPILQFLLFAGMFILFVFAEKFTRTIRQIAQYDGPSVYYLLTHEIMVWKIESFVFPFPALIGFLFFKKRKDDIRFGPRDCNNCSAPLIRQTEKTEDKYMKPGQIQKEKIGVTDYDVWHCNKCQASEVISYPDFSKRHEYQACPSCQFITYQSTTSRTLKKPTYENEGLGEQVYKCLNCKFSATEKFVMAMLVHETISNSSSDYSSSSSSSSSDSSSGGSDWGGGSSGGGGASSTW
jgi:uncharacterized protein